MTDIEPSKKAVELAIKHMKKYGAVDNLVLVHRLAGFYDWLINEGEVVTWDDCEESISSAERYAYEERE